jgi:hypothetical protein
MNMKRNSVIILLLSLFSMHAVSCVQEGVDLCEAELTLKFHLTGAPDETFGDHIQSVDVFLFDAEGNFYTRKRLERAELDEFLGTTFRLASGTYHAVCWANAGENTEFSEMNTGATLENSYAGIARAATGDRIWYAPKKNGSPTGDYTIHAVDVPIGKTVHEMTFTPVYRTVQVYIEGYEQTELYDGKPPVVEQLGAGGRYDFLLRPDPTPFTLEQTVAYREIVRGTMHGADFYSMRVPIRSDMEVVLYHPTTGEVLERVNLQQYMARNNITDDSFIPILFTFSAAPDPGSMDTQVTVSMPDWLDNSVDGNPQDV